MTKLSKSSRTHSHCLAAEENEQTIASLCSSVLLLLFATPGGNEKWRRYCRYKVAGSQQQSAAYYLSSVFFCFFLRRRKTRATKKRMWKRNAEHFGRARVPVSFHFGGSGRDNNRRIPFLFWLLGNNKQLERKWRDGWDPGSKSARYLYA